MIATGATQKDEEYRKFTQELLENDYPCFVAKRLDHAKKNRKQRPPSLTSSRKEPEKITTVVMPFVDGVAQPLQRVLKPLNSRVVGNSATWKWCLQHLSNDSSNRVEKRPVVYQLTCNDCKQTYTGKPGRTPSRHAKEPAYTSYARNRRFNMSASADHVIIRQHSLLFRHVQIVNHEPRAPRRRVKDALHIQTEKNPMNKDKGRRSDLV